MTAPGEGTELEQRIAILSGRLPLANDQPVTVGTGLVRDLLDEIARLDAERKSAQADAEELNRALIVEAEGVASERTARLAAEGALAKVWALLQRAERVVRSAATDAAQDGLIERMTTCRALADELAQALATPEPR